MITLSFFQTSTLITAFVSLFLGFFVFFSGKKTKLNFSWLLSSIFISLWSIGLFGVVFSTNVSTAWFWQHVLDIGGICVPVIYFNFLLYLTKKERGLVLPQLFSLIMGSTLIVLSFTTLFKVGVSPKFGINYWIDPGKFYFLFPAFFAIFIILSAIIVIKEYRVTTDKDLKRQLIYILIAQIFGFGGGLTNFFPQLFNVYPFGNYLVILYVVFISYAALKHHLFDIRVIATELLTFSIWIFLFIKTLLSVTFKDFLLNGGIFIAVVITGIWLIRSVINEIKQKEQIEKMAEDVKRAYIVEKHAKEQTEKAYVVEKHAKEQTERAYTIEKKANEDLKMLDEYKNSFIRQTQHDLRTPLTIMMGYSDMLLSKDYGKLSKKSEDIVKRMQNVTQEKLKDINNFLDLEQFKLGKGVVALKPGVELMPIVKEVENVLLPKAEAKKIYFKVEKPLDGAQDKPITISADREKIKAAIFNVIDNAIKYTLKGGVTVTLNPKETQNQNNQNNGVVVIKVQDTGIGIPKDKIAGIFEQQFERMKKAEKIAPGSGVGLCLSAQIIKLHKGKVWVESEEGKGSAFYIELSMG